MKRNALLVILAILVLGIGITAYAFGIGGDSCPVKAMMVSADTTHGGHDKDCCTGDKDSCPMKGKMDHTAHKMADGDAHKMGEAGTHKTSAESCPMKGKMDAAAMEAKHGDKESCPMKYGKGHQMIADGKKMDMSAEGHTCCPCCDHEGKEKKVTDAAV